MPGVEEIIEKECEKLAERIAGNLHLRRGLNKGRGKWSFSECQNMVKMVPSERARQSEEVGFGMTSFGVRIKKK